MGYTEIIIAILTGGVGAAIVKGIIEAVSRKKLNLRERLEKIEAQNKAQSEAIKYILYDRIRYLGQYFISEGKINLDDRRILNDMHRSYHEGLNGNGDLDVLMRQVNELPLKIEK